MCPGMSAKQPSFTQKADTIVPDQKELQTTPADARSRDAERRLRAGYRQTIFTSPTGAALMPTDKKKAMGA